MNTSVFIISILFVAAVLTTILFPSVCVIFWSWLFGLIIIEAIEWSAKHDN